MVMNDSEVYNLLSDNELFVVGCDALTALTGKSYADLKPAIRTMIRNGQLFSIEKGLYAVRNFKNPYVIGNAMLKDSTIAYWSALNLHHLTEQFPNVVFVQSPHRKADRNVFNVRYKFIQVKPEKMCGVKSMGYGQEQFSITDVEKTLLDCFDMPQYSGGYEELIRAFAHATINGSNLFAYGKQMNNLSVLKRMAYLSELFEMDALKGFRRNVERIMNERYSLLDPMGANQGTFNAKWKVRVNIAEDKLLEMINKID